MKDDAPDIRKIILNRLADMGKTPYWLSVHQRAASTSTVQAFLSGRRDTTVKVLQELLRVTELKIVSERRVAR